MLLLSQKDPQWAYEDIPGSTLSIAGYGCYLTCVAMLGQYASPLALAKAIAPQGGFAPGGLLVTPVAARECGMTYLGKSQTPSSGPCIGMTNYYASKGFPTHFIVVLPGGRMIDPLKNPAKVEPLTYPVTEYRLFDGVKLAVPSDAPAYEAPNPVTPPEWANSAIAWAKAKGVQSDPMKPLSEMHLYEILTVVQKLVS